MPRYFFTIRGRDRIKDDHYGTNLPDVAAALSTAESKIRELRRESNGKPRQRYVAFLGSVDQSQLANHMDRRSDPIMT